jgi:hypothetical protein
VLLGVVVLLTSLFVTTFLFTVAWPLLEFAAVLLMLFLEASAVLYVLFLFTAFLSAFEELLVTAFLLEFEELLVTAFLSEFEELLVTAFLLLSFLETL